MDQPVYPAEHTRLETLLAGQKHALELAVHGSRLDAVLDALVRTLEATLDDGVLGSILLLDRDGVHLRHGAAPSLPDAYNKAIDGISIGPTAGSCGTAAFRREPVVAHDIASDPLWVDFLPLARSHHLRACWSSPIRSSVGQVLGTFALYYREARRPTMQEREVVELLAHTAAIIIERFRFQEDLRATADRYRLLGEAAHDAIWDWDLVTSEVVWNLGALQQYGFSDETPDPRWWGDQIHPDDRGRVNASIRGAIEGTGVRWTDEYRFRRADGSYASVLDRGHVLRNASGRAIRMVGAMLDLTERRRSQARDRFLVQMDDLIRPLTNAEEITYSAASHLGQHLRVNRCAYAVVEGDEDTFRLTGNYTDGVQSIVGRYRFMQFGEECLRLMRAGEPYVVTDSLSDARIGEAERPSYEMTEIRGVICVPISKAGEFVAAMAVHTSTPRQWRVEEIELVQQVASRCWESIERARVTRDLLESERQLRELANSIPNLAWMAKPDGWIYWYNAQWYGYTGTTPAEMEGWGWRQVQDPAWVDDVVARWQQSLETGTPFEMVFPLRRADGEFRRFLTRVNPVRDSAGHVVHWFGTNTDVEDERRATEANALLREREQNAREEAELQKRLLHSLFMQAPTLIAVLRGPSHVVELANPPVCLVWGRSQEDLINRPLFDLLPEQGDQVFRRLLDDVFRTGTPYVGGETPVRFVRADGTVDTLYFDFVFSPFRGMQGAVDGVFVVASDVTGQVFARNQLEELREAAEAANRAKDEFLAMLGHELRNPLSPILTALQLMKLRGDDTSERERTVIERQVNHLTRLVDDLLDVSRIARGKVELKNEIVEVADVVAKAIEMASPLLEQRTHTLAVRVPTTGLTIEGDPTRLSQVVSNLLTNAAKYTAPGGHIDVTAEEKNGAIVLSVRDTGIGIAPDVLPWVFDLFVQERQAIDRAQGGLGLGLTIVKNLVERHGGAVAAFSDGPGRGSEFVVRLPKAPGGSAAPGPAPAALAGLDNGAGQGRGAIRVLVVDDNQDGAEMLAEALTANGYATRIAHDAPAALQIAVSFAPDVAFLDIGLPVMDGYELATRLRELPGLSGVRLVALTGYGQESDRLKTQAAGFDHHLVKPVDLDEVAAVLAR